MNATELFRRGRVVPATLLIALVVTLWAGLHPFSFARRNDVNWLRGGTGLEFGPSSMAVSKAELSWDTSSGPATLGWELWLAPAGSTADQQDILVLVDEPAMPALRLAQSGVDLIVVSRVTNLDGERWYNDFVFRDVLEGEGLRHVVLSSAEPQPVLYVDGRIIQAVSGYGIPLARAGAPLGGRLLVGCSPRALGSWVGEIHGLVVHARAPTRSEIERRNAGPRQAAERAASEPGVVAAYAFAEGEGRVVRDLTSTGASLHLPKYYRPVEVPAFGYVPQSSFVEPHVVLDIVVNVVGFLPLGFLMAFCLFLMTRIPPLAVWLLVVAACAGVSFAIEWVQVLMPTRHSSLIDCQLNTLGAALGAGAALRVGARERERPGSVEGVE